MIIYIDIDETICTGGTSQDYSKASPLPTNIDIFNKLYESGYTIIYWTARGSRTGTDWSGVTADQLRRWNVKYHELKFNKPSYDLFIDDKNLNSEQLNLISNFINKYNETKLD